VARLGVSPADVVQCLVIRLVIFLVRSCSMQIRELEDLMKSQIKEVIINILSHNQHLPISARSRAGAEISNWLEERFVEQTKDHEYLKNSEFAPKGKTKNPWDARTFFQLKSLCEEIWIDFKAFKLSGQDSNPDIGTPDKIIKFIEAGGFYLLYIYVYYEEHNNGLRFVKKNGELTKVYFLKDISDTVRRTPTNQLQVNMSAEPTYRARDEFIDLLMEKYREGLERQRDKSIEKIANIPEDTSLLKEKNKQSEQTILEKIK
jgi:hypothetical protein